jgi:hypothetical protein
MEFQKLGSHFSFRDSAMISVKYSLFDNMLTTLPVFLLVHQHLNMTVMYTQIALVTEEYWRKSLVKEYLRSTTYIITR